MGGSEESFPQEITLELRSEGWEGANQARSQGKSASGGAICTCKGPEVGTLRRQPGWWAGRKESACTWGLGQDSQILKFSIFKMRQ